MDVSSDDQVANDRPVRCESCGRVLESGEQICLSCDRELTERISLEARYPFSPVKTKAFSKVCPCCGVWFDSRRMPTRTWPEKAKWYVPQVERPVCPNCSTALISKYGPPSWLSFLIFLCVFVGGAFRFRAFPYLFWIHVVGIAIILPLTIIYALRDYKDEASFTVWDKAKGCGDVPLKGSKAA